MHCGGLVEQHLSIGTQRCLFECDYNATAALVRATQGHGIIISSGSRNAFELRGPYDVINLGVLFGMSEQQAKVTHSCSWSASNDLRCISALLGPPEHLTWCLIVLMCCTELMLTFGGALSL